MSSVLLAANSGGLDVFNLVAQAGPMAKFVLLVLVTFSVVSWGIIAERYRTFKRAERESELFLERFQKGGGLAAIQDSTQTLRQSPLASIFRAGFREISLNPLPPGVPFEGSYVEALDRVARKNASVQLTELERSLGFLATTAGATPFIGLFGTVWGIMNSFRGISLTGQATLMAYAPGIAEALIATAAGLAAAIPALIGYNFFQRRLQVMEARIDEFIADLIHRVQGRKS